LPILALNVAGGKATVGSNIILWNRFRGGGGGTGGGTDSGGSTNGGVSGGTDTGGGTSGGNKTIEVDENEEEKETEEQQEQEQKQKEEEQGPDPTLRWHLTRQGFMASHENRTLVLGVGPLGVAKGGHLALVS
jgi:hypothetical protein